jgi:hypothetical protein
VPNRRATKKVREKFQQVREKFQQVRDLLRRAAATPQGALPHHFFNSKQHFRDVTEEDFPTKNEEETTPSASTNVKAGPSFLNFL